MSVENAARWAVRLENAPLTENEERELAAWLESDERRRGMLLRAEATLVYLDRGRALASPDEDGRRHFLAAPQARRLGFAAGLAGALIVLGIWLIARPGVEIETAVGEVKSVSLADGSLVSVNTNTRLAVEMLEERREVSIEEGEVWFKVAHDKERPFVVSAGDVRVQAVGTAFSVRKRGAGADVLVTEGVVETWIEGHESERRRIAAGSKGFVATSASPFEVVEASSDIDRALAWRKGEVALEGETLQYAASEINRYNVRKLVIDDPDIASEPLVGYFRVDQPEIFARAAVAALGAQVTVEGDKIRLTKKITN